MIPGQFYIPQQAPLPRISGAAPQSPLTSTLQRKPSSTKKKMPTNSPSVLLTTDENEIVYSILGKGRQTLSTAVVQFLIPAEDSRRWKLQEVGVLCFVRDSGMKSYFLEIISLRMHRVIFSQEIYDEFGYRKPRNTFLTFEGDNFTIGLNFASEQEILSFQAVLDDKMAAKRERIALRQSRIFEIQNPQYTHQQQATPQFHSDSVPSPGLHRRTTSFDNKLDFGMQGRAPPMQSSTNQPVKQDSVAFRNNSRGGRRRKSSKSKPKKKVLTKSDIGNPMDFRIVLHAGLDNERGFVVDNYMDEKFSKLFHMAGVTDKELEDKNTRDFIIDFIQNYDDEPRSAVGAGKHGGNFPGAGLGATLTAPPPPPMVTRSPSSNVRHPPPVPARQTPPPKPTSTKKMSIKSTTLPFVQTSTLPSPTFQNKVIIQPIRQNEIPSPPPPPPLIISGGSGNKIPVPPPPPLMTSSNTVPPPPPPPMGPLSSPGGFKSHTVTDSPGESRKLPPVEDERSALMKQIQDGKKLKKVDVEPVAKRMGGGLLLDQIKSGVDLRKVSDTVRPPPPDSMDGLAGALARALAERKGAINPDTSGSESDNDDDDAFDEDEWE